MAPEMADSPSFQSTSVDPATVRKRFRFRTLMVFPAILSGEIADTLPDSRLFL